MGELTGVVLLNSHIAKLLSKDVWFSGIDSAAPSLGQRSFPWQWAVVNVETHTGQGTENQTKPVLSHLRDIYINLLQSPLREQQGKRGQKVESWRMGRKAVRR